MVNDLTVTLIVLIFDDQPLLHDPPLQKLLLMIQADLTDIVKVCLPVILHTEVHTILEKN